MKWVKALSLALTLLVAAGDAFATESRGFRNNNPGNIEKTTQGWVGKSTECDDPRFECFEDTRYGVRALVLVLHTYHHRHNISDLEGLVHRWSPPHENPSEAIQGSLRGLLPGVDTIGPDNLYKLVQAIILLENGYNPLDDNYVQEVVRDVLSIRASNDVWFSIGGSHHEDMGDESRSTASDDGTVDTETGDSRQEQGASSSSEGQRVPVDEKAYCTVRDLLGSSPSDNGSVLWMDKSAHHYGMDRVAGRVLALHQSQGSLSMENSRRHSDRSPTHPRHERHHWALLRRLPGWS